MFLLNDLRVPSVLSSQIRRSGSASPNDEGWYQLQSIDGSQTYCQTDLTDNIEVPVGTAVKLINHEIGRDAAEYKETFTIQDETTTLGTLHLQHPHAATMERRRELLPM